MKHIDRLLFLAVFFLLAKHSSSQGLSYNKGGTTSTNYFVEMPYQDINGKIIVKAGINGIDYNFLLDTGAPTAISSKILTAINPEKIQKDKVIDVNGNKTLSHIVLINHIVLGNLDFKDIPAIGEVPDFFRCWNIDGIIGSNLLRNSIIQINSQQKTITLTDRTEKLQLTNKTGIPLFIDTVQSYPAFDVQMLNNLKMRINFDTGDNGMLTFSETSMEQLKKTQVYESIARGYGANQIGIFGLERDNQKFLLKFPIFNIDEVHLKNVITVTAKGSGARMLNYGIVTVDFINRRFYYEGNGKEVDLAEKQWPFQPVFNNNKLLVGLVWDNTGLDVSLGEQIVEIDGTSYETVDICDLLNKRSILEGKGEGYYNNKI